MHEDLVAIIALWDNVHSADQLQLERKTCALDRSKALAHKASTDDALQACRAALEAVKSEEHRVMRRLDSYRNKVKTTRTMIDTGKAPDYRLAERQLHACTEIVDELETAALELMEARDEAEQALAAAEQAFDTAQGDARRAVEHERNRVPRIDAELADLETARPELRAALSASERGAFDVLRARGRSAVATMRDGACTACNYGAPSQVVNEINGAVRVHRCRNCGRFLVLEQPDEA